MNAAQGFTNARSGHHGKGGSSAHELSLGTPATSTERLSVADVFTRIAKQYPHRPAVADIHGRSLSYQQLDERANRVANALLGRGFSPGDRIALWLENRFEPFELYYAAAKAGLIIVPLNIRFTGHEARYMLQNSGARALFFGETVSARIPDAIQSSDVATLVSADGQDDESVSYSDLLDSGQPASVSVPVAATTPLIIAYTSGTTGTPKGAVLTHGSVHAIWRMNALTYGFPRAGTYGVTESMSFTSVMVSLLLAQAYVGGRVLLVERGTAKEFVDIIGREHVTTLALPTPLMADFADEIEPVANKLPWLTTVLHGGSGGRPEIKHRLWSILGGRYIEAWGMTENSGGSLTSTSRLDGIGLGLARNLASSVGRANSEVVVGVFDAAGGALPHDGTTIGELWARSPALAAGYWQMPEETDAVFADGWYRTGDLGAMDPEGYVYISDRRTDLIVSGGSNVYPSEVERVIAELPEVRDCAVVAVEHERWGQGVAAVIEPAPGQIVTGQLIIDHCRQMLASYKKPVRIFITAELPRNVAHKVQRHAVRQQVERGELRELAIEEKGIADDSAAN